MKPVIIGSGLAGLITALSLAPMPVILLSPRKLGQGSASAWAQGGIAAAMGTDDSAALHASDTMSAGAGICDPDIVHSVTEHSAKTIATLLANKVPFDRDETGQLRLSLEAAHSRRRIVHAADSTGSAIIKALIAAVHATPSIEVIENATALELQTENNGIIGVSVQHNGGIFTFPGQQIVLAAGGAGALWKQTTNPLGSWGRGLLLAANVGAILGDLEFMQFHPTAIDIGRDPMPLASEALRGEGCTLINDKGERFADELQPRDVVARAIWQQQSEGRRTFLDARRALGKNFAKLFPNIHAACMSAGIDPAQTPIPVVPAAHYHMGGVVTDEFGRTNVEGLWACGEVASTGLHGANRLASNSLLEAACFGERVAQDIASSSHTWKSGKPTRHLNPYMRKPAQDNDDTLRTLMTKYVGVQRDEVGLQTAIHNLIPLAEKSGRAMIGLLIATTALQREESRGAHARTDFPAADPKWQRHQHISLADIQYLFEANQRLATGT